MASILEEIRTENQEYKHLSDRELTEGLHKSYYPNADIRQFAQYVGYKDPMEFESNESYMQADKRSIFDKIKNKANFMIYDWGVETGKRQESLRYDELMERYTKGKEKGKKDFYTPFTENNIGDYLPFVAGLEDISDRAVIGVVADRYKNGKATKKDEELLRAYAEYNKLPSTMFNSFSNILTDMPSFMGEFAMTYALAGQLTPAFSTLGGKAIGWAGGSTIQTTLNPVRIADNALKRMMPDVNIDDARKLYIDPNPEFDNAIIKAFGDTWAEVASERTGFMFEKGFNVLGKIGQSVMGRIGLASVIARLNKIPLFKVTEALKKFGFNGVFEEMLEEEAGKVFKDILGVEQYKKPTLEELIVQFLAFSVPSTSVGIINSLTKDKNDINNVNVVADVVSRLNKDTEKIVETMNNKNATKEEIKEAIENISDIEKSNIVKDIESKETEETEEAYELEKLNIMQDAFDAGIDAEVAEKTVNGVFDAMINSYAKTLGMTKIDLLKKIPLKRGFKGDMEGGLKQTDRLIAEARKYDSSEEFVADKTKINISENSSYSGQDMKWTEIMDEPIRLKKPLKVNHFSDTEIKSFYPKETAFFVDDRGVGNYRYTAEIPAGTIVQYSKTGEEIRVNLDDYKNIKISLTETSERKLTDELVKDRFGGYVRKIIVNKKNPAQQLTDIWNKAQEQEQADPLIAEARKYEYVDNARETIGKYTHYKQGGKTYPRTIWADWFQGQSDNAKSRIVREIIENKDIQNALMSNYYNIYKEKTGFNGSFDEFINKKITLYRGENPLKDKLPKGFEAYTLYKDVATSFAKRNNGEVSTITIKPRDTYGAVDYIMGTEVEVLVPTEMPTSELRRIVVDKIQDYEFMKQYNPSQLDEMMELLDNEKFPELFERLKLEKPKGEIWNKAQESEPLKQEAGALNQEEVNFTYSDRKLFKNGEKVGNITIEENDKNIYVADIEIDRKGKGTGTEFFNELKNKADNSGKYIILTSDAMRGKEEQKRQRKFYESLGFIKNKGTNKVKGISEEYYYKPQEQVAKPPQQPAPLIAEARKYKSAEEFDKAVKVKGGLLVKNININPNTLSFGDEVSAKTAEERGSRMAEPEKMTPIRLAIQKDGTYRVIDGNARLYAYQNQNKTIKDAIIDYRNSDNQQLTEIWNKAQEQELFQKSNVKTDINREDVFTAKQKAVNEGNLIMIERLNVISDKLRKGEALSTSDKFTVFNYAFKTIKQDNVDRERVKELGYTKDIREAGYIQTDGKLIDLSGKKEGGEAGTRTNDHREVGGTIGMQEFMREGNIRLSVVDNVVNLDIAAEPSQAQYIAISKTINSAGGDVVLDVANGIGTLDTARQVYREDVAKQAFDYEAPKATKVINDIKNFYKNNILKQSTKGSYKSIHGEAMLRLFKAKDQSTLIHELSHYFLDLVLATNPEFIRPVMKEIGIKDVKKKADYVKLQEYFARSNEAYLREGKSPKPELDSVFAKFKEWLKDIYKKLSDLDVQLTPTMRAFFDSLYSGKKMETGIELYQKEIKSISEYTEQLLRSLGIGLKVTKKDIDAEVAEKEAMQANHPKVVLKDYERIYVPEGMRADMASVIDAYKTKFTTKINEGIALDVIMPELAEIMGVDESRVIDAMDNATKNYLSKSELRAKAKTELIYMQNIKPEMTIKQLQTELTKFIQGLDIEAKDKAKFISTIKEATTNTRLANILKRVSQRAIDYKKTQMKRIVDSQIAKELKQTKDIKKGQLKVGKYDYETNKLFKKLREYSRLTKEFAFDKLVTLEQEYEEQMDNFKRMELSLLSWKSNGADGTYELSKRVLDDIQLIKAVGELAKDENDFNRRVNRQAEGQDIMDSLLANKMNKNVVTKKTAEYYARGFGDIYSMLLAITNSKVAERYNFEIEESNRDASYYERSERITKQAEEILGSKKEVLDLAKDNETKYTITDKNNEDYKLTKMQLLHMYVMLKNEHYRNAYNYHYNLNPDGLLQDITLAGETYQVSSQIADLLSNLTEQEIDLADMLQNEIQDYYAPMNEIYIKRTGKDMGRNEEYFPASSEHQEDFVGDFKITTNIPSSMKERSKGMPRPTPQNIWTIALKHIAQAEHTINITDKLIETRQILEGNVAYDIGGGKQKKIKNYIEDTYGKEYLGLIKRSYEDLNLGAYSKKLDLISGIIRKAIGNWVGAKIAMNPSVFAKQLVSVTNYATDMPVAEWSKGFMEGLANPRQTWDYMMETSPYLKSRINQGYSEAIVSIMNDNKGSSWTKMLTSFTRYGDIIAIVYGGYPYMKHLQSKGLDTKKIEETFRSATLRSQQSGLKASRSELQKNDNLMFIMAFMNTPTQYLRMPVNASIQFANGEISRTEFAKIMTNYLVVQPILYTAVGYFMSSLLYGGNDEESLLGDLLWSIVLSPFNAIPLLNGIAKLIARKMQGKKSYKAVQVMLLDDINLMAQKMNKKEKTMYDYLSLATTPIEVGTMIPAKTAERFYVKNMERFFGEEEKPTKRREYARRK